MIYSKELKVLYDVDVLVAGGGPAGVAAGISAARQGKSVLILEQHGTFGGMATVGMVPEFMCFDDGVNLLSSGIGGEIKNALFGDELDFKCYNIRVEDLKALYDKMVIESGAKFLFFSKIVDVVVNNGKIEYAIVSSKKEIYAVKAKFFIDCTGDGDLSVKAGADFEYGDENGLAMPATLCSFWSGIDFEKKTKPDGYKIGDAYQRGFFTQFDLFLPGIKEVDRTSGVGGGNIGHAYNVDETSEQCLTDAMILSRKVVKEYERYYREYVPGCEDANLCFTANILGVREGRRIECDYKMKAIDYLKRAVFEDEIGRYNYPVDIHPKAPDEESLREFDKYTSTRYERGESYGISLKCLIVKKVDNLFVAGKCICSERELQASMRVMPCCFITGQAAGVATTVCIDKETSSHSVDYKEVQRRLIKLGAHLPNFKE